ncbi:hypothetical protein BN946_scf184812.g2 [Trametes cinnabarina]|uniref:Fungal-type protein kinase domain-containing protein n=1 Tax=Pycnoporus cinnabarinus TaxID=5643 RepID=A0A060SQL6_PYCCI|nr:hypothetical protein BN946_scf184812.g2 [Trametes cinnabarina]
MPTNPTPLRLKSSSSVPLSRADVLNDSPAVKNGWASELNARILTFPGQPETFIDQLLPCSTPFPNDDNPETLQNAFKDYTPVSGQELRVTGVEQLAGLQSLVKPFPDEKKLEIVDTHLDDMEFPFHAFERHHQHTKPDISVSFPGKTVSRRNWQTISMAMEAKGGEKEDPFTKNSDSEKHVRTVEQLAKNARNLLIAHGFLSAFVVGIYGRTLRLARFDHSCAVVTAPFSLDDGGARLLKKFFWHFVHPIVGDRVVGADPTVMPFTPDDCEWVKTQLSRMKARNWENHVAELEKGRRVDVYDQRTGKSVPYLLYCLIDVNARLFSRATMVWRAIEDTRIWKDGQLVPDPDFTNDVKPRILKEAWRQLVRHAETTFYERLYSKIPRDRMFGLARMEHGGDIGVLEARWWRQTVRDPMPATADAVDTNIRSDVSSSSSGSARHSFFCSIGSTSPEARSIAPSCYPIPDIAYPLLHPQHQTYSWRLHGPNDFHHERSHMRMVIEDVGHPLTQFTSSREMVTAIRDAIKGHQTAWVEAQVLHRDVSVGNILISDDPSEDSHRGFLHDFDYSSMEAIDSDAGSSKSRSVEDEVISEEDIARFKERTGTFYFIALALLKPRRQTAHQPYHDLESFYWVLVWVVLRHTVCWQDDGPDGEELCKTLFTADNDAVAHGLKSAWLDNDDEIIVADNTPLTNLLAQLTQLVYNSKETKRRGVAPSHLTYEAVLALFDKALAEDGWPENDWKPCSLLRDPDPRTGVAPIIADVGPGYEILADALRALRSRTASRNSQKTTLPTPRNPQALDTAPALFIQSRSGAKRTMEDIALAPDDATHSRKRSKTSNMGPPVDPGDTAAGPSGATTSGGRGRRSGSKNVISRQPTRSSSRIKAQKERNASRNDPAR